MSRIIKKIRFILKTLFIPSNLILYLASKNIIKMSDEKYLSMMYKKMLNKTLNLKNPVTFNEKLQWLKLNDRNPKYIRLVDKYEVKEYIKETIGEQYVIPTIGVYNKFNDIDFSNLPNQFVIKCTHDSGGIVIVKDKEKLNINKARRKINKGLKRNFYYYGREWPYKHVKPRIIIEKYMEDNKEKEILDYKFFCFDGEPKLMYISQGLKNHETASMSFYDMDYKLTTCKRKDYRLLAVTPERPINFEKMKEIAGILSKGIPHVRVDFYEINGNIYFGELTFFTCSGFVPFESDEWDNKLGQMIKL